MSATMELDGIAEVMADRVQQLESNEHRLWERINQLEMALSALDRRFLEQAESVSKTTGDMQTALNHRALRRA